MSEPGPGHNTGGVAGDQLRAYIERIERLEEEKKTIGDDIRDVYAEAKGNGFCAKTMRKIVGLRKKDASTRSEEDAILDLYLRALGMQMDLPLASSGESADGSD